MGYPAELLSSSILLLFIFYNPTVIGKVCNVKYDCGWNNECVSNQCQCIQNFQTASNGRDCTDPSCGDARCIECDTNQTCRRCVDFIVRTTSQCIDSCPLDSQVLSLSGDQLGYICSDTGARQGQALPQLYLIIIIIVSVCVVLLLVLGFLFYWRSQRTGTKTSYHTTRSIEMGNVHQNGFIKKLDTLEKKETHLPNVAVFENPGFEYDEPQEVEEVVISEAEKEEFMCRLLNLKSKTDIFLAMLNEARIKYRSIQHTHPKVLVYKNVIHQLCRVLTLLNKHERDVIMPADGLSLLQWGDKTLKHYLAIRGAMNNNTKDNGKQHPDDTSEHGTVFTTFGYSDGSLNKLHLSLSSRNSHDSDEMSDYSGQFPINLEDTTSPIEV